MTSFVIILEGPFFSNHRPGFLNILGFYLRTVFFFENSKILSISGWLYMIIYIYKAQLVSHSVNISIITGAIPNSLRTGKWNLIGDIYSGLQSSLPIIYSHSPSGWTFTNFSSLISDTFRTTWFSIGSNHGGGTSLGTFQISWKQQ